MKDALRVVRYGKPNVSSNELEPIFADAIDKANFGLYRFVRLI
jgi:hypothetical protein